MKRIKFLALGAATAILAAAMPRFAFALPSVNGTWACAASGEGASGDQTGHFTLKLHQSGRMVSGSYYDGTASLSGTFSGNTLKGTWKESESSTGVFAFVFESDGQSFTGTWGPKAGSTAGTWSGTRT